MAFDAARHEVVLFGGADGRSVRNDTWGWDGREWRLLASEGPPARTFAVLVYDDAHSRLLLFGGNRVLFGTDSSGDTTLGDLWAWNGREWTEIDVAGTTPAPRAEACGAYDVARKRLVVFGGYTRRGGVRERLGDTWEWDGERWLAVATDGPGPRSGAATAYVPSSSGMSSGVLVFGGATGTPPPRNDTWLWDGRRWMQVSTSLPDGRYNAVMAYDEARNTVVRFGGWTGSERTNELSTLKGASWVRIDGPGPSARNHTSWAYDRDRSMMVLYGGHDGDSVFADTWCWGGDSWMQLTDDPAVKRLDNGH